MTLNAIIIDDEPLAHKVVLEYVKDVPFIHIVGQYYSAMEALPALKKESIDLIFLDINMPKIKGIDFLKMFPVEAIVIITSAYEKYALESFELNVCDYLLKPFRFDRFMKAVHKASELHTLKSNPIKNVKEVVVSEKEDTQLFIKSDKRLIHINRSEIYYIESYGNYVKVWISDTFHLTPRTLASFVEQLPDTDFFKIHKSYLIHRKYIDYIEGNFVLMKNGKQLPIGKSQRASFKRFIES